MIAEGGAHRDLGWPALLALAIVGALGSIAIHIMVPALPQMARDLSASPHDIQLAITVYLAGLGVGQLIGGAASDAFGRRRTMSAAIVVFLCATIGICFTQTVGPLIGLRFIEALGGGAALVAARTLVADRSRSEDVAPRIAIMTSIVLISPAVSPFLGGLVTAHIDWRALFYLLILIALATLGFSLRLGDQRAATDRAASLGLLMSGYRRTVGNLTFWRYTLAIGCASAAMYVFLGGSSFLLIERYGLTSDQAGACYLLVALGGIGGTLLVRRLERGPGAFRAGLSISCLGAVSMALGALAGLDNAVALIAPMLLVALGAGLSAPAGFTAILRSAPGAEGVASSLGGACQMLFSGAAATLIAQSGAATLFRLGAAMTCCILLGWLAAPSGKVS